MPDLKIIPTNLLKGFDGKIKPSVKKYFQELTEKDFGVQDFKNYMIAAAVASSQIEGSTLDLNSFYQSKENKKNSKEVAEIENLLKVYQYAKRYSLSQKGLLKCHEMLSASFSNVIKKQKGKYRQSPVGIRGWSGLIYVAADQEIVQQEMNTLFDDIEVLLNENLTLKEVLYYAAAIHFLFAKIHPFADGNGRAARLLEKWFLAENLGASIWGIPTEKFYYDHRSAYYTALNVGATYEETLKSLNNIMPFLELLPQAVCYKPVD